METLPAEFRSVLQNPADDEAVLRALVATLKSAPAPGGRGDPLLGGAAEAPSWEGPSSLPQDLLGGGFAGPAKNLFKKRGVEKLPAAEPAAKRGKPLTLRPPAAMAKAVAAKPAAPAWPAPDFLRWCTRLEAAEAAGCSEHEAHLLAEDVPAHLKLADEAPLEQCEAGPAAAFLAAGKQQRNLEPLALS